MFKSNFFFFLNVFLWPKGFNHQFQIGEKKVAGNVHVK